MKKEPFFVGFKGENRMKKQKDKKKEEKKIDFCEKCKLYKNCLTPKMPYTGKGRKGILIIGEAPGANEDEEGIQFIGRSGKLLRFALGELGIIVKRDCWLTNAIICRPMHDKTPTTGQINYCRHNLKKTIQELKPKKIITLGKVALQSLIGDKVSVTSIGTWMGWQIPDQDYKAWIFPNYHPFYLLRNQDDIILNKEFIDYLKQAIEYDKELPDYGDVKNNIEIIKDINDINGIVLKDIIAFDYETTGLKPYKDGHEIICMSISIKDRNIVFPIFDNSDFVDKIKELLTNSNIKKIAHNLKFEHVWSNKIFGVDVKGWYWDTMLSTHILDNRSKICGLKFQTYVNFGVVGYDDSVKKYLENVGGDEFNNVKECDLDELLLYCGMDSYFTYKLYEKHKEKMIGFLNKGFNLFMDGIVELSNIQLNGVCFDKKKYEENDKMLIEKMDNLYNNIQNSKEVKKLKLDEDFNFNSTKELRHLLYEVLKWETEKKTATGLNSTDKEVLESFKKKFTNDILEHRYLKKIKDTYLAQFNREAISFNKKGWVIYPNFNLHTVRTYRSSSNAPNFQNIPSRDKFASGIVKGTLIPSKGNKIMEVDYSGIEVRISTCYHHDPKMISYIENPENDMHRDMAVQIFEIDDNDEKFKEYKLRYQAKNKFVFPQFYGDYWRTCAHSLWDSLTEEQRKDIGLISYRKFESHVQEVEEDFWGNRFKVYNKWKEDTWNRYLRNGFVRLKTGFICKGIMGRNDVLNYPIQGSAFHCLLWSLIRVNRFLVENKMKTKIIGQIHDSLVFDLCPEEEKFLFPIIKKIMCEDIKEYWKWIIVPLDVKFELTEIDQSWNTKKRKLYENILLLWV